MNTMNEMWKIDSTYEFTVEVFRAQMKIFALN
jgi:hypothetical protein